MIDIDMVLIGSRDEIDRVRPVIDTIRSRRNVRLVIIEDEKHQIMLCIPPTCYRGNEVYIVLKHMLLRSKKVVGYG